MLKAADGVTAIDLSHVEVIGALDTHQSDESGG